MRDIDSKKIERIANALRNDLFEKDIFKYSTIEILNTWISKNDNMVYVEICTPYEIGEETEAEADTTNQVLRVRDDVWSDMKFDRSRARFTLLHEIGHFVLKHDGLRKRNASNPYPTPMRRRQESEANQFAAYFLAPTEGALECSSADEISARFEISKHAAKHRFDELEKLRRKKQGIRKPIPAKVFDFMEERQKRNEFKFRSIK